MKKKSLLVSAMGVALVASSAAPAYAVSNQPVKVQSIEFIGSDAPSAAQDMAKVYTNAKVEVTYSNGVKKLFPLSYNTLFKTTDKINGTPAGLAVDVNGKPIMDTSVPNNPVPFVSDDPDSNSLMKIEGQAATALGGNPLSLVTHYEYITKNNAGGSAYGQIPASMSLTTIDQNKKTGELKATDLKKIDFSAVGGLWIPCNGSLSPWNTHLGSEEYEADARAYEADPTKTYVGSFTKNYFQDTNKNGNPYAYGFIPEVTVNADRPTKVAKHYSMGRFSHELSKVMADERTVYFGDDGGNTMMFMYVADKAKDLSSGTLYAAKWQQTSDQNGGSANLQWVKLGHATDAEISEYINKGIKFSDMFETAQQDTAGFTKIKTYPSGKVEWLKVKPGMEKAAAFLESRRYGAILGATAEFNKMEGVTFNAKDKKVYIAISYLNSGGMLKDTKNEDPQDDIQLQKIGAGATYELALKDDQKDRDNNKIDSEYVATTMNALVVGEDLPAADDKGNTANINKVANPDNLSFSPEMRTLFIGEDSGMHTNNYLWAYNVDTKKLTRVLSMPAGAEATGLQAVDNYNGFSYIMSNLQHPGEIETKVPETLKSQIDAEINKNFENKKAGMVGYISGFPQLDKMKPFDDVKDEHWASKQIQTLNDYGLVSGYENNEFRPENSITRAEFIKMVVSSLGLDTKSTTLTFKDKDEIPGWGNIFVQTAVQAGLVSGYEDNTIRSNQPISRAEMVKILVKGMKLPMNDQFQTTYKDKDSIPDWARAFVQTSTANGLVHGREDGRFAANEHAKRAEVATVLYNWLMKQN